MRLMFTCQTAPHTVVDALIGRGYNRKDIFILPYGDSLKANKKKVEAAEIVVLLGYADLHKNLALLNSSTLQEKTVIAFAPVVKARLFSPAVFLDVLDTRLKPGEGYRFKPFDVNLLPSADAPAAKTKGVTANQKVVRIDDDYLPLLIENVTNGSLLNRLMTLLYMLPNVAAQSKVKEVIVQWLVESGESFEDLVSEITKLLGHEKTKLSEKYIEELRKLLVDDAKNYLEAFAYIRQHRAEFGDLQQQPDSDEESEGKNGSEKVKAKTRAINYKKLTQLYQMDPYEIRYLLHIYSRINFGSRWVSKSVEDIYYGHERNSHKRGTPRNGKQSIGQKRPASEKPKKRKPAKPAAQA